MDALADGRERPRLGVRRRAPRPDPRQGPRAHRAVAVLVRPDRRHRREPRDLVRPHRLPRDRGRRGGPGDARARGPARSGSSASCAATCSGTAGASTSEQGTVGGFAVPGGLCAQAEQLPAAAVHADHQGRVGPRPAAHRGRGAPSSSAPTSTSSCATSRCGSTSAAPRHARERGLILADTKFEFGELDGEILVIDEMMTPDSSRYWPLDAYEVGTLAAVVRQAVRARLHGLDRLGPRAARAAHAGRGDREHARQVPRGLRAAHRPRVLRLVRRRRLTGSVHARR